MPKERQQRRVPPVKVEMERIHAAISACISDFAVSLLRAETERLPHPGRWEVAMAKLISLDEQSLYQRDRRDILDSNGKLVSRYTYKSTAEYLSAVSPDVVLVLLDTVEALAAMVARYRNDREGRDLYSKERVLSQVMGLYCESVPNRIAGRIEAVKRETQDGLPDGCRDFADVDRLTVAPKGRGRVLKYNRKDEVKKR